MISAISGSILGSATSSWFEKTAMGRWFFTKMDNIYNWAANRYGLEILKSEDKWRKKYPNIAKKWMTWNKDCKILKTVIHLTSDSDKLLCSSKV